jgi:hypothetical protein
MVAKIGVQILTDDIEDSTLLIVLVNIQKRYH